MRRRSCSLKGCEDTGSTRHSFLNPRKYPDIFAHWVTLCRNEDLLDLTPDQIYRSRKVCHRHFTHADIRSNVFLKRSAIPTKLLPSEDSPIRKEVLALEQALPSTSKDIYTSAESTNTRMSIEEELVLPSTSKDDVCPTLGFSKQKVTNILSIVGVTRSTDLSSKAKKLYKKAVNLTATLRAMKHRHAVSKNK